MGSRSLPLIERLGRGEARRASFIAPSAGRGRVRVRVEGLVQSFWVRPRGYRGWAIFQDIGDGLAVVRHTAKPSQVERYLSGCVPARLVLVRPLRRDAWLAWPAQESSFSKRLGTPRPVIVRLVTEARRFDTIVARCDGAAFWHERLDRKVDPRLAEGLRSAFEDGVDSADLLISGLTPEGRVAYALAIGERCRGRLAPMATRVGRALTVGGGRLAGFAERGDHWLVEWIDRNGARQMSAVDVNLQIISAGICLDDRDADFDLASLVGVVSDADNLDEVDS